MNSHVKEKLDSSKYQFLQQEKVLKNRLLYLVVSGSYGYGTQHETSDIDLRGCAIEGEEVLFGLDDFEQYEDIQTDTVIYGLKKFMKLALKANPHILELLGIEDCWIYKMTEEGRLLRENAHLFLSQRAADSFGGYAMAQLRRLQNALLQDTQTQLLKENHIAETLSRQIKRFNCDYANFEEGHIEVYVDEETAQLKTNIKLQGYPLRDFTAIYANMSSTIKSYEKLTHRNQKKEVGKLYKHAMHLVRLLVMGTYILEGKGIKIRLEKHLPTLLSIRQGEYTWEKIFQIVNDYEKNFNRAAQLTKLPETPHYLEVETLLQKIYKSYY